MQLEGYVLNYLDLHPRGAYNLRFQVDLRRHVKVFPLERFQDCPGNYHTARRRPLGEVVDPD